jgi:hypothetical protein
MEIEKKDTKNMDNRELTNRLADKYLYTYTHTHTHVYI